jgi:hypothetical protein
VKSNNYYLFWVCVCSLRYLACNAHAPYYHLCPLRQYSNFPHYLINGTVFLITLMSIIYVFWFSVQYFSDTFIILRRSAWDMIINVEWYSCKVPVTLVRFWWNFNFLCKFSKNTQISNSIKIRRLGNEFFHADRRTDRQTNEQAWRSLY